MKCKIILFFLILYPFSICFSSALSSQRLGSHHLYLINKHKYISFKTLSHVLYLQNFAKVENRIYFQYHGIFIKSAINSSTLIAGQKKYNLGYPVEEVSGKILFPLKPIDKILSDIKSGSVSSVSSSVNMVSQGSISVSKNKPQFVILIDPGHGGIDSGAIGPNGLYEKNVNLDIALRLRKFLVSRLKNYPYVKIDMTRDKDETVSLRQRVVDAINDHANMFFCIHTNSAFIDGWSANGFETFYPRYKQTLNSIPQNTVDKIINNMDESSAIKDSILLASLVQKQMQNTLNTPNLGVRHAEFYVLRFTPMVSILTEVGFISNPNIETNLRNLQVRQAIAEALGRAILSYLRLKKIIPK